MYILFLIFCNAYLVAYLDVFKVHFLYSFIICFNKLIEFQIFDDLFLLLASLWHTKANLCSYIFMYNRQ